MSLVPLAGRDEYCGRTLLIDPGDPPMETRPPHPALTALTTVFPLVSATLALSCPGVSPYPDAMQPWSRNSQWPMRTATAAMSPLAVASVLVARGHSLPTPLVGHGR
ncbi:hypothetical protein [Streptomyces sp. NPDC055099]